MTEKRFYIGNGENCTICDSSKGGSDFFNMLTQYEAVDLLNDFSEENEQLQHKLSQQEMEYAIDLHRLSEENEQLKLLSNHRGEMVSFATSLIQDMGSEEMLKMWNDFKEVMYQKWKKKRGIK